MSSKKAEGSSKLGLWLGVPVQALSWACDSYVRGMSACTGWMPTPAVMYGGHGGFAPGTMEAGHSAPAPGAAAVTTSTSSSAPGSGRTRRR